MIFEPSHSHSWQHSSQSCEIPPSSLSAPNSEGERSLELGFAEQREIRDGNAAILQRDQGDEGEGAPEPLEADVLDRLRQEIDPERIGQLPCQVHPDQLGWASVPCLLWWHDLLVPRGSPRRAPTSRAPAAREGARRSLIDPQPIYLSFKVFDWIKYILFNLPLFGDWAGGIKCVHDFQFSVISGWDYFRFWICVSRWGDAIRTGKSKCLNAMLVSQRLLLCQLRVILSGVVLTFYDSWGVSDDALRGNIKRTTQTC